jgi:hypothetical protein
VIGFPVGRRAGSHTRSLWSTIPVHTNSLWRTFKYIVEIHNPARIMAQKEGVNKVIPITIITTIHGIVTAI